MYNMKYPRTYHLPYSPGATNDDKTHNGDWFSLFKNNEIVITEKLDGENTAITREDCFARSHATPTRTPWTRNLWGNNGLLWKIKDIIGEKETIYGENLFGEHSIHYDSLTDYWYLFAVNDGIDWYSWDDVELTASTLGIRTVPILYRGIVETEEQLKSIVLELSQQPSVYGKEREGVVVRNTKSFPLQEFHYNVAKYVRANHVQTDVHWTKTWKQAKLSVELLSDWDFKKSLEND